MVSRSTDVCPEQMPAPVLSTNYRFGFVCVDILKAEDFGDVRCNSVPVECDPGKPLDPVAQRISEVADRDLFRKESRDHRYAKLLPVSVEGESAAA